MTEIDGNWWKRWRPNDPDNGQQGTEETQTDSTAQAPPVEDAEKPLPRPLEWPH